MLIQLHFFKPYFVSVSPVKGLRARAVEGRHRRFDDASIVSEWHKQPTILQLIRRRYVMGYVYLIVFPVLLLS